MRLAYILIFVLMPVCFWSQQQMVSGNFIMNDYYYNAAVAGSKDYQMANLSFRKQWAGFNQSPSSIAGNFFGSIRNQGKVGYGVSLISDRTGLVQNTGVYVNYAQHFKLNDKIKLGLGIRPGYMQYRVKLYDAQLADAGDEILTGSILSANAIDMDAGFNLYSSKFFFMGGFRHVLGKAIDFTSFNANLQTHYNFMGGYNFELKKKKLEIQPSMLLKFTKPVPAQLSVMVKATYDKKYWAGLLYRTEHAVGLALGMQVKDRVAIGYSYDYSLSGIRAYQSGSHEIMISIITNKKKPTLEEEDDKLNNGIMEDQKKRIKRDDL